MMKYVIFRYGPFLVPMLCPEHVNHSDIKLQCAATDPADPSNWAYPVSAGFCVLYSGGIDCDKKRHSTSLKLGPCKHDWEILDRYFFRGTTIHYQTMEENANTILDDYEDNRRRAAA